MFVKVFDIAFGMTFDILMRLLRMTAIG